MSRPIQLLAALFLALTSLAPAEASVQFRPKAGVLVLIDIQGGVLTLKVALEGAPPTGQTISFETERPLNLVIDDFNFDGVTDLSVWSMDEGKGKFEIHRVFVFDQAGLVFREVFPSCGDEFLNLKADHATKELISTYFRAGVPVICRSKPQLPK